MSFQRDLCLHPLSTCSRFPPQFDRQHQNCSTWHKMAAPILWIFILILMHWQEVMSLATGFTSRAPDLWPPWLHGIFPPLWLGELWQGLYGSCLVCADSQCAHLREQRFRTRLRGVGGCCGDSWGPRWSSTNRWFQQSNIYLSQQEIWKGNFSLVWPQMLNISSLYFSA